MTSYWLVYQVESFIPFWDWDIKKKKKSKKDGKKRGNGESKQDSADDSSLRPPNAGAQTDSDTSRPPSARGGATIEEVKDEDDWGYLKPILGFIRGKPPRQLFLVNIVSRLYRILFPSINGLA